MGAMEAGDVLDGRYRLVGALGRGGFGEVWKAFDERMLRHVAIKVLGPDEGGTDSSRAAARFWQEAVMAGGLSHAHIVTVYDFGRTRYNGHHQDFLVMELLPGRSLSRILAQGPPSVTRSLAWASQICEALHAAHGAGVIHRDIKPPNVMVDESTDRLKVLDFGIAKSSQLQLDLTLPGQILGSVGYMAPERITLGPVDARSDLYSLGCVLHELLTGRPPFSAPGADPAALLHAHVHQPPPAPGACRPGLPPEADRLVLDLLAKDPAQRPHNAAMVRERLAALEKTIREPGWTALLVTADSPEGVLRQRLQEAETVGNAGRAGRARILLRGVVSDCTRALGPDHPCTLTARLRLAYFTGEAGYLDQARIAAERLVRRCRAALGNEHRLTLGARVEHARWTEESLRAHEALALCPPLIADCTSVLGPDAVETLEARLVHAHALSARDDDAEARDLSAGLMSHCARVLGDAHPLTFRSRALHALSTFAAGETERAIALTAAMTRDCGDALGPDAPTTLACRLTDAVCLTEGDLSECFNRIRLLVPDFQRVMGHDAPLTLMARALEATATTVTVDHSGGMQQLERVAADSSDIFGHDAPLSLVIKQGHATFLAAKGDYRQAHALLTSLVAVGTQDLGPDAFFTQKVKKALSELPAPAPPRPRRGRLAALARWLLDSSG
ncbi:serine/threonine-protein kinase [Streptomyces sp. NPDC049585]|uniref:serine/threonine-protein kinase n=1 Tax=Streptomyces sp. NPDC049585 TaxID=3155154 RepID=UPI003417AFE8